MASIYSTLFGSYLRLKASMTGDRSYQVYKTLNREQWLPLDQLEHLQVQRLKALLHRAVTASAYYREQLAGLKDYIECLSSLSQLAALPVLTRDDLQKHYREMLCPVDDSTYSDSSGGSTGHPVNFYHDAHYQAFANGIHLLFLSWIGVSRGDRTAVFWGADRDFGQLSVKDKLLLKLERMKSLNSFNVHESALERFLTELETFRPDYIYGYASSLALAAQYLNQSRRHNIRPRAVRSAAEMLYRDQRQEIEKAFQCPVYNFYGSREVNNLAAECPAHDGLHVFASGRIVEVVDDAGRPVAPGEIGLLAVTDLTNLSFPFIRYMIGDMGALKAEPCRCGRTYPLLAELTGRSSDIIKLGGKYIHGEYFTHLFYGRPEVRQFQVVQEAADRLVIRVVAAHPRADLSFVAEQVRQKVGGNVDVTITLVDDIPPLKSGKYRFTVNQTL